MWTVRAEVLRRAYDRKDDTMTHKHASQIALAAAALFVSACHHDEPTKHPDGATAADGKTADVAKATKIKCFGVNECSTQGACDVPDNRVEPGSKGHDCAGNNTCKGKGWVQLTTDECTAKGGEEL